MTRRRTLLAAACLFALVASAGGCRMNPATGERMLALISAEQEIALGAEAAPEFENEFGGKVNDLELQAYVRQVGAKLAAVSPRKEVPYEYALLRSDAPNAFALPGGKVYVTAGLMGRMSNERQLAAVLGHETAHVAALHNVQGLQKQMGVEILAELAAEVLGGSRGEAAKAGAKIAGGMVLLRYSREHEYQADAFGIDYMAQAGYNPWGMVELLTTLKSMSDKEPGSLQEMFQTHPLTSKRIEEAEQTVQGKFPRHNRSADDPQAGKFLKMRQRLADAIAK